VDRVGTRFFEKIYLSPIGCFVISSESSKLWKNVSLLELQDSSMGHITSPQVQRTRVIQKDPGDPGELICYSHNDLVDVHSLLQSANPDGESVLARIEMHDTGPCAMDEQSPHIRISPLI
jgi:hypothetical protein